MQYIKERVRGRGQWTDTHTLASVTAMYEAVAGEMVIHGDGRRKENNRRDAQMKWSTVVCAIARKKKRQREPALVT